MTAMIGFLGTQKDARGYNDKRWHQFRPTVGAVCHEALAFERYYLIHDNNENDLLELTKKDMLAIRPSLEIIDVAMPFDDAFGFTETLSKQVEFVLSLPDDEEYLINFTSGSTAHHVTWFELVKSNFLKAKIVQLYHGGVKYNKQNDAHRTIPNEIARGKYRLIDLSLTKYDGWRELETTFQTNDESYLKQGLDTRNRAFNEMIALIEKVAVRNNRPCLIDGPTGAGKTRLATLIYELKKKKGILDGSFKYLNCATLRANDAHSVLFGHVKGAFTGGIASREGALKQANNGLLFLDEVGTLPEDIQGMLLHAIEAKEFYPMGSDTLVSSNFTLICGTNIDLEAAVEAKTFRDDLLARINLWHFTLPSLNERKEDIEPNIDHELRVYAKNNGHKVRFNNEARALFLTFALSEQALWKRNFRDLSASIERMATLSERGLIKTHDVNAEILRLKKSWAGGKVKNNTAQLDKLYVALIGDRAETLDLLEQAQLKALLGACVFAKNAAQAARAVYTNSQGDCPTNPGSMFAKALKKFDLHFEAVKACLEHI
jgi:transcriptional regulatory protein RtcR